MKSSSLLILLGVLAIAQFAGAADAQPTCATAWFTQAVIENSVQTAKPVNALPEAPGTAGKGVILTKPIAIENPVLSQKTGYISFWIKPNWNGNDGKRHVILRIGDPTTNGLILEKSPENMLRYLMASPKKVTASRADVSHWKAGEWHQVAISWYHLNKRPIGLPLWIDKTAVDGSVAGANEFLNPATMEDTQLWIGDKSSDAVIDELIMRNDFEADKGQLETVWRDYFRTAPYTKIRINPDSCRVPSDKRVLKGYKKQFGMDALGHDGWKMITANEVRYHTWADFDAKPFIKWSTSNPKIATVDENGLVTGVELGKCKLIAEMRGMKSTYNIEVASADQPDLDLLWVEVLPRYKWQDQKDRHAPGDTVTAVAHIENYGFQPVPAGTVVRFELFNEMNDNYVLDKNEMKPVEVQEKIIDQVLNPRDAVTVEFRWTWPANPQWFRVTVDPDNKVPELCEANNQITDLTISRPLRMAYVPEQMEGFYNNKQINHIGSFSQFDWMNAQKLRFDLLVRETVLPETSPVGIKDSYRVDMVYTMLYPNNVSKWQEEPFIKYMDYYDGGFPYNEHLDIMAIDVAILHEFGHVVTALPDLYGYPMSKKYVYLKDENGDYYAGTNVLPTIDASLDWLPFSKANNVPCGIGEVSLMEGCHLWIHPAQAGNVQYYSGFRGQRFWGVPGRDIPQRANYLQVFDINDEPLTGAAIYVYHLTQTDARDASTKFFSDRPKFIGNTDREGRYLFPELTDESWDDPDTDVVEGAWPVWNPFGRAKTTTGAPPDVAFTPNVWCVEGLLLIKIVKDDQIEFAWLALTDFNQEFYRGNNLVGTQIIRTNLFDGPGITETVRPVIPEAIQKVNLKPVAVAPEKLTVKKGEAFTIDGSKSYDPENQPLIYHWNRRGRGVDIGKADGSTLECTATAAGQTEIVFWVNDGLRVSEPRVIAVTIEE